MANIWDEFDKAIDTKALAEEAKNSSSGDFAEVPHGTYEVKIEKMELVASKSGKPMVSIWFRILNGDFENSMIFMNQVVEKAFGVHNMNEFLRSLGTSKEIEFVTYKQYGNLLMDMMEEIDGNFEYALKYGENRKGYNTFEIEEVFELEN